MIDDPLWKRRFHLFALVRLAGVAIVVLGVAAAFTDLIRDGGWRGVGALIIVAGTIVLAFGPVLLKARWSGQP